MDAKNNSIWGSRINQLLRLATEGKLEEDIAMGYPNKEDMKKIKKKVKKARDTSDSDEK